MRNEGPHPCAPEDIATPSQVIVVGNNTSPDVLGVSTKVSEDLPLIKRCEAETSVAAVPRGRHRAALGEARGRLAEEQGQVRVRCRPCPSSNLLSPGTQFRLHWPWRATCAMSCLAMPMPDNSRLERAFNCRAVSRARNQRRKPDRTTDKNMTQTPMMSRPSAKAARTGSEKKCHLLGVAEFREETRHREAVAEEGSSTAHQS